MLFLSNCSHQDLNYKINDKRGFHMNILHIKVIISRTFNHVHDCGGRHPPPLKIEKNVRFHFPRAYHNKF